MEAAKGDRVVKHHVAGGRGPVVEMRADEHRGDDEDAVIERAAAILERRGYPQISSEILWAIGRGPVDV